MFHASVLNIRFCVIYIFQNCMTEFRSATKIKCPLGRFFILRDVGFEPEKRIKNIYDMCANKILEFMQKKLCILRTDSINKGLIMIDIKLFITRTFLFDKHLNTD